MHSGLVSALGSGPAPGPSWIAPRIAYDSVMGNYRASTILYARSGVIGLDSVFSSALIVGLPRNADPASSTMDWYGNVCTRRVTFYRNLLELRMLSTSIVGMGGSFQCNTNLYFGSFASIGGSSSYLAGGGTASGLSSNNGSHLLNGVRLALATKTTTYPIVTADGTILCDATSAAFTVTLPSAAATANTYQVYVISKTDASGNAITIATTSSQTISGKNGAGSYVSATTYSLAAQGDRVMVQSNGANWWIIGT